MPPPPGFSLGQSEFNDFLFEFVVDEKDGPYLTVISALAQLDLNPWDEAARLARLPRAGAIDALTAVIREHETEDWQPADPRSIATRLVDYLPKYRAHSSSPSPPGVTNIRRPKSAPREILMWLVFATVVVVVVWSLSPG